MRKLNWYVYTFFPIRLYNYYNSSYALMYCCHRHDINQMLCLGKNEWINGEVCLVIFWGFISLQKTKNSWDMRHLVSFFFRQILFFFYIFFLHELFSSIWVINIYHDRKSGFVYLCHILCCLCLIFLNQNVKRYIWLLEWYQLNIFFKKSLKTAKYAGSLIFEF